MNAYLQVLKYCTSLMCLLSRWTTKFQGEKSYSTCNVCKINMTEKGGHCASEGSASAYLRFHVRCTLVQRFAPTEAQSICPIAQATASTLRSSGRLNCFYPCKVAYFRRAMLFIKELWVQAHHLQPGLLIAKLRAICRQYQVNSCLTMTYGKMTFKTFGCIEVHMKDN